MSLISALNAIECINVSTREYNTGQFKAGMTKSLSALAAARVALLPLIVLLIPANPGSGAT